MAEAFSGYFRRMRFAIESAGLPIGALEALASDAIDGGRIARLLDDSLTGIEVGVGLRRARRLLIMALMERDIAGRAPLEEVCAAMSQFAAQSCKIALRAAGTELAEQFGLPLDGDGLSQDLLAIAMGKGGADELNVSSDLDLIFVYRDQGETSGMKPDGSPTLRGKLSSGEFMHRLARRAIELLSEQTADGFVFRIDTRLRPNGDSGPLACSLPMLEEYFYAQGREWERFAWLKGKLVADSGLAGAGARVQDESALARIVEPFVFRRYLDYRVFAGLRDLHSMIRKEANKRALRRHGQDVKLGRGGIREIEFSAQLFQVVRGGRDPGLHDRSTLTTLAAIGERGLLPPADTQELAQAYHLLRRTEHMLQYREDEQTHRLPDEPEQRASIAAMLGLTQDEFERQLANACTAVERIFDELLREPDAPPVPDDDEGEADLDDEVRRQLRAMREGPRYRAAQDEARGAIERLVRDARLKGTPARGMTGLIDLCETVCRRPGYLALLAQYPEAFDRVLQILAQSRWATQYLLRHPIVLDELIAGEVLDPVDFDAWSQQLEARLDSARHDDQIDVEHQMDIAREAHHSMCFRLLVQNLQNRLGVESLSDHLSEMADRIIAIAIERVWDQNPKRFCDKPRVAAIAYGRLGGKEMGYTSDLDLVFIYQDDDKRAQEAYSILVQRLSNWLSAQTSAGTLFEVDLRLRPNGNAGLLVSSLASFSEYQREQAWVWEHQALSRARFCAGDLAIGEQFESIRRDILSAPRDGQALRHEITAMRKRMHEGHPNRSKLFDIKHDAGGMVDIEFIVQYLVLRHASEHLSLRDNVGNITLLLRASKAGLIPSSRGERLADAYRHYRQLQHAIRLDGAAYARVDPTEVAADVAAVKETWHALFEN